jgi:hypothetical protein
MTNRELLAESEPIDQSAPISENRGRMLSPSAPPPPVSWVESGQGPCARVTGIERGSHVFRQIYDRRCPIAYRGELRPTEDEFKGRCRGARAARADGRCRSTGAPRRARRPGAAGSARAARRFDADPAHPAELRPSILHRSVQRGRGPVGRVFRRQTQFGDLPYGEYGVLRAAKSRQQPAGRGLREVAESMMHARGSSRPRPQASTRGGRLR